MSNIIKPTVGRKVWYRPSNDDQLGPTPMVVSGNQPLDATIISVWDDRVVNLLVTDVVGRQFPVLSVRLLQGDDKPHLDREGKPSGRYAEWMPYQKAQVETVKPASSQAVAGVFGAVEDALIRGISVSAVGVDPAGIFNREWKFQEHSKLERLAESRGAVNGKLYSAIKEAMDKLGEIPENASPAVNAAFNTLRKAFWLETPAPANAAPERAVRVCRCGPNEGCIAGSACMTFTGDLKGK